MHRKTFNAEQTRELLKALDRESVCKHLKEAYFNHSLKIETEDCELLMNFIDKARSLEKLQIARQC